MSTGFVVWESEAGTKFCSLGALRGVTDEYEITRGVSRANGFPSDASFQMNKRFPKQVALADSAHNRARMVVVSEPLKELIEGRTPPSVELLPVRIINHKGRDAGKPYWVVNPLAIVDCIDQTASRIEWNPIDPTMISCCNELVLDEAKIPPELVLFRPKYLETIVLVRQDLADAIEEGDFTGLSFTAIDEYVE
jgi:hypothetical protein